MIAKVTTRSSGVMIAASIMFVPSEALNRLEEAAREITFHTFFLSCPIPRLYAH